MSQQRTRVGKGILALVIISSLAGVRLAAQEAGANPGAVPPPVPRQELPEVLIRGPVHEAFAEPVDLQMQAPVTAPSRPPADIEEVPPTDKPEGEEYIWVPGYWSWDEERNAFIWVSACWRVPPPGLYWVPGYWVEGKSGWDWVSGLWAPFAKPEVDYLPAPPQMEDTRPGIPAPSDDSIWVSPCYYWSSGQYVLRTGYWLNANPDWVWIPSHYVWTPRGYLFAQGHWDYALANRGVLFAPVYFSEAVRSRPAYTYSPNVVVDLAILTGCLFAYPRYSHYYFGDYYDGAYLQIGIFPWFDCDRRRTWYDPLYQHNRWQHHRSDPRWEDREREEYDKRCNDRERRPPRTYHEQNAWLDRMAEPERKKSRVAMPVNEVVIKRVPPVRMQKIDTATRHKIEKQGDDLHQFSRDRHQWESVTVPSAPGKPVVIRTEPVIPASNRHTGEGKKISPVVVTPPPVVVKPVPVIEAPVTEPRNRHTGEGKKAQPVVVTPPPVVVKPVPVIEAPVTEPRNRHTGEGKKNQPVGVAQPPEVRPEVVPPRAVRATRPERVVIPVSPVVEKTYKAGSTPNPLPPQPDSELWSKDDDKGSGKESKGRGRH